MGFPSSFSVTARIVGLSLLTLAGCFPSSGPRYTPGAPAPGFQMSWRIVDARIQSHDPTVLPSLPCANAGVTHIKVDLFNQDTAQSFSFLFECGPGIGQTLDVTIGRYQATVAALDAGGMAKSQQTFTANNTVSYSLGLVIFQVFPPA